MNEHLPIGARLRAACSAVRSRYAKELSICVVAVALLELAFYLNADDSFSLRTYLLSVLEVFAAPAHPGWRLIYPPAILCLLYAALFLIRNIRNEILRPALAFLAIVAWAALGFATIVARYG